MTLVQMKKHMNDIVEKVSRKYEGGEYYFNEIDSEIKNDLYFLSSYFQWVYKKTHNPIILSGEIGELIFKYQYLKFLPSIPTIIVNGNLRDNNNDISYLKFYPIDYSFPLNSKFTMIDDSYYSGKTVNKVKNELQKLGYKLENVYVFYDGSLNNKDNIKSLYRYYLD